VPTPETQPFWDGVAEGRLLIQYSRTSGRYYFYPRPFEPGTLSEDVEWREASGRARLESYVINHRPVVPAGSKEPQIIALVTLEEGVRMVTVLTGIDPSPEDIELDMELEVVFEDLGGTVLPLFRPAAVA
jgi:Predicted nucleic-acid-binding protein containing a Zn-ribbon